MTRFGEIAQFLLGYSELTLSWGILDQAKP